MRKRKKIIETQAWFGQSDKNYEKHCINKNIVLLLEVLLDIREMLSSINLFNPEDKK